MANDICTDIETCTCYIEREPNEAGCQYTGCPGEDWTPGVKTIAPEIVESTDGTRMHTLCWNAYGRMWDIGHPNMKAAIVDAETYEAERKAGA